MTILHYVTNLHTDFVISFFWMLAECYVSHMAMMQYNWFFFVCWWNVTYVSHMAMMKYNLTFVFRMLAQCLVSHMAIMFFFFVCWHNVWSPTWQWIFFLYVGGMFCLPDGNDEIQFCFFFLCVGGMLCLQYLSANIFLKKLKWEILMCGIHPSKNVLNS